jgi:hypothetical protein
MTTLEEYLQKAIADEINADPDKPEDTKLKRVLLQKYGVMNPLFTEGELALINQDILREKK